MRRLGRSPGHRKLIASFTLYRVPDQEQGVEPGVDKVREALHSLFEEGSFAVHHRATLIDNAVQVVFDVYEREAANGTSPAEDAG